jgi:serine/threonine protein kinase/tetratricopeptide (TPR) repeat protein
MRMRNDGLNQPVQVRSPDSTQNSHWRVSVRTEAEIKNLVPSRFLVKEALGRGGMGTVFRAFDQADGSEVALKLLHSVGAEERLRLKAEFRAVSSIAHPNLVNLYELVVEEGVCFFSMELVRGVDFAQYVSALRTNPSEFDSRFREAALQLALALNALHCGGKLHRDVKPSNVLVTDSGRVVLLDFGLTSTLRGHDGSSEDEAVVAGTLLYMSPEASWGANNESPASDWYSFGVTLYQALLGQLPSRLELLKFCENGRQPTNQALMCSADISQLIAGLLQQQPTQRPATTHILSVLGEESPRDEADISILPPAETPPLLGRELELQFLRSALQSARAHTTQVVRLLGPSGIGKSALMEAFLREVRDTNDLLILRSRCHPQETVVFNAIDGLMDDLCTQLDHEFSFAQEALELEEKTALARVFPALGERLDLPPTSRSPVAEGKSWRHAAFAGVRKLLLHLSTQFTLVLWLDDLQWADEDSGTLIRELLLSNERPRMLAVWSYRQEDKDTSPCLLFLRNEAAIWTNTLELVLRPLDDQSSQALLDHMVGSIQRGALGSVSLPPFAGGSPFLLGEYGRYLSSLGSAMSADAAARTSVDDLLHMRLKDLPGDSQKLLELLAVAGAPLEQHTALAASGLARPIARGLVRSLERRSIVRTKDVKNQRLEFYHDKLRESVLGALSEETRMEHHKALGQALMRATEPNPLAAIEHFESGKDLQAVRRYILGAANQASKLLAFERAARLYERAIEVKLSDVPEHELQRRLGSALGSAGHGKKSAQAYTRAAELLSEDAKGNSEQIVAIKQRAAEQYIQSGHFRQGTQMIRDVLSELGVEFPATRGDALRKATRLRLLALFRGVRKRDPSSPLDALTLRRFDALFAANTRLAMIDYALCSYATARCATDAVKLGEPSRLSRALGMEAAFCSTLPQAFFQNRADKLHATAWELSGSSGSAGYDRVFAIAARAIISFYKGRYRQTWVDADEAQELFRRHSPGRGWEHGPWQMWSLLGLALNGEIRQLIKRVLESSEEAALREDRHTEQNVSLGAPAIAWLALDRAHEALDRANQALAGAPESYTVQHYQHYVTTVDCDLYANRGLSAWQRTESTWADHKRESFLLLNFVRDDLWRSRGRSALAAALELQATGQPTTASGKTQKNLLQIASQAARQLASHATPFSLGFGALLSAGLGHSRGSAYTAEQQLLRAMQAFEAGEMRLFLEATRYLLGVVTLNQATITQANVWFADQGIVNPERLCACLAPGLLPQLPRL